MNNQELMKQNEVKRVIVQAVRADEIAKVGRFLTLEWLSDKAYRTAQKLLRSTKPENRDDNFWNNKYYAYCRNVFVMPNVGVTAGLHIFLQQAAGLALSPGTAGVFGGPASTSGTLNKGFLGVGNGLRSTTLNGAVSAGATTATVVSATNIAANDWVTFEDSTASQQQGTNVESVQVASVAGAVLTLALPIRFAHANSTYVVRAGAPGGTDLPGVAGGDTTSKAYRAIDNAFPTEGLVNTKATLTWQSTFISSEALFAWNEALIGAVPSANTPPATATGTFPASALVLAAAVWYPSPLTKGATSVSQQYQVSVA